AAVGGGDCCFAASPAAVCGEEEVTYGNSGTIGVRRALKATGASSIAGGTLASCFSGAVAADSVSVGGFDAGCAGADESAERGSGGLAARGSSAARVCCGTTAQTACDWIAALTGSELTGITRKALDGAFRGGVPSW